MFIMLFHVLLVSIDYQQYMNQLINFFVSCADPEGGRGSRPPP